jgi:excisionase family DNA binding protein
MEVYGIEGLARLLGVPLSTLTHWLSYKGLQAAGRKEGRRWVFETEALKRWVEEADWLPAGKQKELLRRLEER